MPMNGEHQTILNNQRLKLVRELTVDEELISALMTDRTITPSMKEEIEGKVGRMAQAGVLLTILPTRRKDTFERFIEALVQTGQADLARLLDPQGHFIEHYKRLRANPLQASSPQISSVDEPDTAPEVPLETIVDIIRNREEIFTGVNQMSAEKRRRLLAGTDDVYPLHHPPKGHVIIVNNMFFVNNAAREGTDIDRNNLVTLFKMFGYTVNVKDDCNAQGIKAFLTEQRDVAVAACVDVLIVVIMSHGERNVVFGVNGEKVKINPDILDLFSPTLCPGLAGKPKLFFFQACQQAGKEDPVVKKDADDSSFFDHDISKFTDVVLAFASCAGYKAWRYPSLGSGFMRSVMYVLANHAHKDDVLTMLTEVTRIVMGLRSEMKHIQLPLLRYTISKPLYLMPL